MKILFYGETPTIETGTGQLSKHLLHFITNFGYEVEMCAINHFSDDYDHVLYPYEIHASPDNEAYNLEKARDLISHAEYDVLLLSADVGQLNALVESVRLAKRQRAVPVIIYTCVDCDVINAQTLECLTVADVPLVYSEHSRRVALQHLPALSIQSIPLGCEPDVFYPLSPEERRMARKTIFNVEDDTFLAINVNRNQWRKDPGRTLMIFHEFHKRHPDSLLYMHMKMQDIGGNLPTTASMIGMSMIPAEVMFAHPDFSEQKGFSRQFLNRLYNCADCMMTTSTGEGWGLSTTEAMAAGCPVVAPHNSSFVEIIGEERGYLCESGGDIDHMVIPYGISDNPRSIVHAESMLAALEEIYSHPKQARIRALAARQWTLEHTWQEVREQWREVFSRVESKVKEV